MVSIGSHFPHFVTVQPYQDLVTPPVPLLITPFCAYCMRSVAPCCFACVTAVFPPGEQAVRRQEWPLTLLHLSGSLAHHWASTKNYTNKNTNSNSATRYGW